MDRMLGAAFGQLQNVGGKKQIATDEALLGVSGTRVKYANGLLGGNDRGGNLAERSLRAQMGGAGSMFGGGGPKRTQLEKEMENVRVGTDQTAANTDGLRVRGSAYVHDIHSESLLDNIFSVLKDIKGLFSIGGMAAGVAKSEVSIDTQQKALDVAREQLASLEKDKDSVPEEMISDAKKNVEKLESNLLTLKKAVEGGAEKTSDTVDKSIAGTASEDTDKGVDSLHKIAMRELKIAIQQWNLHKKDSKLDKKSAKAVWEAQEKLASLDSILRKREVMNPLAGGASDFESMAEYNRIMAGNAIPEMEEFTREVNGSNKSIKESNKASRMGLGTAAGRMGAGFARKGIQIGQANPKAIPFGSRSGTGGKNALAAMPMGGKKKGVKVGGGVFNIDPKRWKEYLDDQKKKKYEEDWQFNKDADLAEKVFRAKAYNDDINSGAKTLGPASARGPSMGFMPGYQDRSSLSNLSSISDKTIESMAPAGGYARGSQEPQVIEGKFDGTFEVKFNTPLLDAEIIKVQARGINTPEVRAALDKAGRPQII